MSYELLENDLTDSTLWLSCSKDAKLLFITILSKAFGSDVVRTPIPVLYQRAGLSDAEGAAALAELMRPDPASKFRGEEGRRVVEIEDEHGRGLWLPSYASRRKRYLDRNRKRNQRDKRHSEASRSVTLGHAASRSVTEGHAESRSVTPSHEKSPLEQSRAEDREEKTPPTPRKRGARVSRDKRRAEEDLQKEREIRRPFFGSSDPTKADEAVRTELGYVPSQRLHDDDEGGPF